MDVPKMKLSDLPFHLVSDILLRLPLETLLSCRYVCKAWDGFFTNPEFVEVQLAASPIHFLKRFDLEEDTGIHFGRVVKVDGILQAQTLDFTHRCENSSNGLLCLTGRDDNIISVCNPLLGQSVNIPGPVDHTDDHRCAIGFSPKDKLYKVLVGYPLKGQYAEDEEDEYYVFGFEIYTLGTREWRVIDSDEDCRPWSDCGLDFNTFLYGSLLWASITHSFLYGVTAYVPSFVSLQDVAKGEEVKVSRITYEAAQ